MADGTTFDIALGVSGGAAVDAAGASLAVLAKQLKAAGDASLAASDAVKAGEVAYRQAEASADRAAKAHEALSLKAAAAGGTNEKLNARQAEAATKAQATAEALQREAAALDHLKAAASSAADAEKKVASQQDAAKKAAANLEKVRAAAAGSGKVNEAAEAFGKLGGPLGKLGQQGLGAAGGVEKLTASLGTVGPFLAVAIALTAIAAAAVTATIAIASFAVAAADSNRSSALLSAGIARSVKGGEQLDDTLDSLITKVPQSREELQGMASQLANTGLRGDALSEALETAAVKAAKLKFGPDFEKQMLALPNQAARFKANIGNLFGGLKIDKLLEGLATLVSLFDQNEIAGKAIKVVFEDLFQPVIDGATGFVPVVERAFLQLEILVLRALITIKPYGSTLLRIGELFGVLALSALAAIGIVIAIVGAAVVVCIALSIAVQRVFGLFAGYASQAINFLKTLDFASIGKDIVLGLVGGITGAGPAVVQALTNVVGDGITAAKKALGIASPSKVFAEIGAMTAEGMTSGVEAGTSGVQSSFESMVAPPAPGGGGTSVAGGSHTFQITINAGGGAGESIAAQVRAVILDVLEGDAAQLGGMVAHA